MSARAAWAAAARTECPDRGERPECERARRERECRGAGWGAARARGRIMVQEWPGDANGQARDGPERVPSLLSLKQVDPKRRKETYRGLPLFEPDQLNVERSFLSHVERSFSTHANSPSKPARNGGSIRIRNTPDTPLVGSSVCLP